MNIDFVASLLRSKWSGLLFIAFFAVSQTLPRALGWAHLAFLPSIKTKELASSKLPFEAQQKLYIQYHQNLCRAVEICQTMDSRKPASTISLDCELSAKQIATVPIPTDLPKSIQKNMQANQSSLINSTQYISRSWSNSGVLSLRSLARWEIDTCGLDSVSQKLHRLYQLDQLTHSKLVTCTEIQKLPKDDSIIAK